MIQRWKAACDAYWLTRVETSQLTHWMDVLFTDLFNSDAEFKARWERVPYINCEDWGEAHSLAGGNMMGSNVDLMRQYDERVPHALKFWKFWTEQCGNANDTCTHTTGYHALALARRCSARVEARVSVV